MNIADVSVGDELGLEKELTRAQLFRYSAMTWNPHRIHYDPEYAREVEGHPDVLVQAQLHGAVIQELVMDWLNGDGRLVELGWRNVGRATPERTLRVGAEITDIDSEDRTIALDAWTETDEGRAAEGTATVRLFE
jgi:hydroxyacyl-ACP dehydratase HTD2-like protein with hotdog domain